MRLLLMAAGRFLLVHSPKNNAYNKSNSQERCRQDEVHHELQSIGLDTSIKESNTAMQADSVFKLLSTRS